MTKKIFFSYSFTHRLKHEQNYLKIKTLLKSLGHQCYSFVFDFQDQTSNSHDLMVACIKQIDNSDILIADPCYGSFGIGIEAGYAKAKDKKIIYLHKLTTKKEETLEGIADHTISYSSNQEILDWLSSNIDKI